MIAFDFVSAVIMHDDQIDYANIQLTPERLRFLCGDLLFAKKDIEKLTGWPRSAINTLFKNTDLKLDYPTHRDMTSRDFADLKDRLALTVEEKWQNWSGRRRQYRNALLSKAADGGLDWQALDRFIAELPARQDREEEERRRLEEQYYLPNPIVLELMVKRSSDGSYLAVRDAKGRLSMIAGHLKRSEIFHESIGGAAQRILGAAFGINASFTDVLDVSLDKRENKPTIRLIVVLTVDDVAANVKPRKGWSWVHFSKLLSARDYPMLNYL